MREKLELTGNPQDAVLLVSFGWTGGMGEAVLDPATGGIRFFGELPIFVDSEQVRRIAEESLPESCIGELRVLISANIQLVRKTGRNPSIRGAPEQDYWEVRINELRDVKVVSKEKPCRNRPNTR
jgi:hypothetical protein